MNEPRIIAPRGVNLKQPDGTTKPLEPNDRKVTQTDINEMMDTKDTQKVNTTAPTNYDLNSKITPP